MYSFLRTENTKLSRDSVCELLRDIRLDDVSRGDFVQHLYQRSDNDRIFSKSRFAGLHNANLTSRKVFTMQDLPKSEKVVEKLPSKVILFRKHLENK